MPLADLELDWTRTLGLGLLALPVLLLLLARLRTRPPEQATGTLPVWKRISSAAPSAARTNRPRIPPYLWLLALALAVGATALAGPRLTRPAAPRGWTVLLDHSASTRLPWLAEEGPEGPGDSRLERALEELFAWMEDEVGADDTVTWSTGVGTYLSRGAERPPRAELFPPRFPVAAPDWGAHDRAGVVWVTDRAPDLGPEAAGLFAAGGAAVQGPIAVDGADRLDWDGAGVVRVQGGAVRPSLHLAPEAPLPAPVERMARVWAESRGIELSGSARGAALSVRGGRATSGASVSTVCGRDGWTASVQPDLAPAPPAPPAPPASGPPWQVWLTDRASAPLVRWRPGEVHVALGAMDEPEGDPAAFAVSWSRLFEEALLPAPGVVALEDRLAAGDPFERAPDPPPAELRPETRWTSTPLDAWLAGAAALLALAAMATGLLAAR